MSAATGKRRTTFPTDAQLGRAIDVLAAKGIRVTTAQVLRDRVLLSTGEGITTVHNPWDSL